MNSNVDHTSAKNCASCGKGKYRKIARAGRFENYKGTAVELPASLPLKECDVCHEILMSPHDLQEIAHLFDTSFTNAKLLEQATGIPIPPGEDFDTYFQNTFAELSPETAEKFFGFVVELETMPNFVENAPNFDAPELEQAWLNIKENYE